MAQCSQQCAEFNEVFDSVHGIEDETRRHAECDPFTCTCSQCQDFWQEVAAWDAERESDILNDPAYLAWVESQQAERAAHIAAWDRQCMEAEYDDTDYLEWLSEQEEKLRNDPSYLAEMDRQAAYAAGEAA